MSLVVLTVLLLPLSGTVRAADSDAVELTVMTRNLYLGGDLLPVAGAENIEQFLAGVQTVLGRIAANNFPERAAALAAEIAEKKPHLVGLQEVYNYTINGVNGAPPFRNYLNDLLDALAARGASYHVAAAVLNANVLLPVPGVGYLGITDHDVILAREDVETEVVDLTGLCRQSEDGCNYTTAIEFTLVNGATVVFERGFVGVDTDYGRFFNTHLEIRDPDPAEPFSAYFQTAQAAELINIVNSINQLDPPDGPVILAGDFNSSPEHQVIAGVLVPPYMQFLAAGYMDVWTMRPGDPRGYTCCFAEDLGVAADLYERVDLVLSDTTPDRVKANVVGNDEEELTPSGLWPSDHAGLVARMKF